MAARVFLRSRINMCGKKQSVLHGTFKDACLTRTRSLCTRPFAVHNYAVYTLQLGRQFFQRLLVVGGLCGQQCGAYASTHGRRMRQLWTFYSSLYAERAMNKSKIVWNIAHMIKRAKVHKSKLSFIVGAAVLNWKTAAVMDNEVNSIVDDSMFLLERLRGAPSTFSNGSECSKCRTDRTHCLALIETGNTWEEVLKKDHIRMWRKKPKQDNCTNDEYRVLGSYNDIPARAFWNVQLDLGYRKNWDKLVVKLDIIDREPETGSELIHWITHFPFPMDSREYVFVRRHQVDARRNVMVLVSRSLPEHSCDSLGKRKTVRVTDYHSHMVIRPHTDFDQNGFDYVLVYYDDPKAVIPGSAYKWMATAGTAEFLERVYTAAKKKMMEKQLSGVPPKMEGFYSSRHVVQGPESKSVP